MKALFLTSRTGVNWTGDSCRVIDSWPWERQVFCYEDAGWPHDDRVLALVREAAPDVIAFISVCYLRSPTGSGNFESACHGGVPQTETFRKLREVAPVVHVCFDGGEPGWFGLLNWWDKNECFDAQLTIDGCHGWPLAGKSRCWAMLTPIAWPDGLAVPLLAARPTPFAFAGTSIGIERSEATAKLRRLGMEVKERGETSFAEYLRCLTSIRISLNMAWSGGKSIRHVKGRVVESALAGCCLLEERDAETSRWFTPGEDYAVYGDENEAASVARALLADLDETQCMADRLRRKVQDHHSPRAFWNRVLDELNIAR